MHGSSRLWDRLEMLTPPLPWDRPHLRSHPDGPLVVLLHGLWRGWRAMEPLSRALHAAGFTTLNIPYPSSRLPVPVIAKRVHETVLAHAANRPCHWVTHSLGGILARTILTHTPSPAPCRVVMLAPPNQGSEVVDWSHRHPVLHTLLGPAGRSLGTRGLPASLPPLPPQVETAVIMGTRGTIPFFRPLLAPQNDGIVSVPRGRLDSPHAFRIIDADHTFIQTHPDAVRLTVAFLSTGQLPHDDS
jgi:pimeloyl-ACP methyl ester carboxylesterase